MPRKFVQDVVPNGRRSIRNIPLPSSRSAGVGKTSQRKSEETEVEVVKEPNKARAPKGKTQRERKGTSIWFWVVSIFVIIAVVYGGSFFFVSARVEITPKTINVPIDTLLEASTELNSDGLTYSVVSLTREAGKEVAKNGEEQVETRASGKIVIYNDYGTSAQTLIKNTRFMTSDGLVYRIQDQVSVPGRKTVNGVSVPGSLTVTVYADQPGERYNIGLSDFTIPGFEGDPRFEKITAKSDPTSPIGGGFVGTVGKVSDSDKSSAKIAIESQLRNELRSALGSQIPDTHVLFNTAAVYRFEELPQAPGSSANTVTLKEKGTIHGILFEREELAAVLADNHLNGETDPVYISNLDEIGFSVDEMETFNPESNANIEINLKGSANFIWQVNEQALKDELKGKKKAQISQIFGNFDFIDRASVSIRPPWIRTFPADTDKIDIIINDGF